MFSVADLIERAKARANIDSDYRLCKVIGIKTPTMSGYRAGKSTPDARVLEQLCALAGEDLAIWAANLQAERERTPEGKTVWLMIAKRLSGAVTPAILAAVFAISLIAGGASDARASGLNYSKTATPAQFIHRIKWTFWPVYGFLLVRLRQFVGLFRLSLAITIL